MLPLGRAIWFGAPTGHSGGCVRVPVTSDALEGVTEIAPQYACETWGAGDDVLPQVPPIAEHRAYAGFQMTPGTSPSLDRHRSGWLRGLSMRFFQGGRPHTPGHCVFNYERIEDRR